MHRSVWHKSDEYIGIDKRKFFDERKTICGDAAKRAASKEQAFFGTVLKLVPWA